MRRERFAVQGPVELELSLVSGEVRIAAADAGEAAVSIEALNEPARKLLDTARVSLDPGGPGPERLVVELGQASGLRLFGRSPSFRVDVGLPPGSVLAVTTVSADVAATGRFGQARVKSVSGDVAIGDVDGDAVVKSVSGDLEVGRVGGEVSANTISGDVSVRAVERGVEIKTVSGDLDVGSLAGGRASLTSVSGDIKIGVAPGAGVWMDASSTSGKTRSELEAADGPPAAGPLVEIRAKAVSGDIRIVRAA